MGFEPTTSAALQSPMPRSSNSRPASSRPNGPDADSKDDPPPTFKEFTSVIQRVKAMKTKPPSFDDATHLPFLRELCWSAMHSAREVLACSSQRQQQRDLRAFAVCDKHVARGCECRRVLCLRHAGRSTSLHALPLCHQRK
mmetsp:Transcript_22720/g.38061  ORF Transcript_22720/g.38061 Transcript_22720/m.38061 type:complete len:141 (+) Transcript_22720:144-566(+)